MIWRWLAIVALCALAVSACRDGDKPNDEGQPDYRDAAIAVVGGRLSDKTGPTEFDADALEAVSHALERQASDLEDLSPPPPLRAEQAALVRAMEDAAKAFGHIESLADIEPESEDARLIAQHEVELGRWGDAFKETYGVDVFYNEGASMEPAFSAGDRLIFSPYEGAPIARWSVVVFRYLQDETRTFLKRVVGLPGETIEVRAGAIHINGTPVEGDKFALGETDYAYGPRVVPPNSYVVLGDNRRNSFDSHQWAQACEPEELCDMVPADLIIGVLPPDATPIPVRDYR